MAMGVVLCMSGESRADTVATSSISSPRAQALNSDHPLPRTHPLRVFLGDFDLFAAHVFSVIREGTQHDAHEITGHVSLHAKDVANHTHIRPFWFKNVEGPEDIRALSIQYGVPISHLETLNPGVDFSAIDAPARILIYRHNPDVPARSVGAANRGHFVEGMPMITDDAWVVRNPARAWATPQSVRRLVAGMRHVARRYPGASTMMIGDMSRFGGGRMRPHRSHQSGRDADVTYYALGANGAAQFWDARSSQFDAARTWSLFRYWLKRDWVEFIFVDRAIQRMLADYAYSVGEDPDFVRRVIEVEGAGKRSIIRDSPGHDHHFHVRFRCLEDHTECE